jgi:hypothetical protein
VKSKIRPAHQELRGSASCAELYIAQLKSVIQIPTDIQALLWLRITAHGKADPNFGNNKMAHSSTAEAMVFYLRPHKKPNHDQLKKLRAKLWVMPIKTLRFPESRTAD